MHLWSTKPEYGQTVTGVQDGVIVAPNQGLSAPAAGPEAVTVRALSAASARTVRGS